MPTPGQTIGDPISHEPDWQEHIEFVYCADCDQPLTFKGYDPIEREVLADCTGCQIHYRICTGPDPDTAYDREE